MTADEWEKEGWARLDTDYWAEFLKERWGEPGKALLRSADRIIKVRQRDVWHDLDVLIDTDGKLYRRESEYDTAYARCRSAHKQKNVFGVVLTGSPGSGKSYCAFYVLLKRLARKRPVLFTTRTGDVFYFDESGVRTCRLADVSLPGCVRHLRRHPTKRVWSLIDPGADHTPVSVQLTQAAVFHVVFASPDPAKFGYLLKRCTVQFIMDPWRVAELHVFLSLAGERSSKTGLPYTLEEVRDLHRVVGPCPRDINTAFRCGMDYYKSDVQEAVRHLDIASAKRIILELRTSSDSISDHIAVLGRGGRDGEIDVPSVHNDLGAVTFKTEYVAELVRRRFLQYELHSAARLFDTCSTTLVRGRTAALAGILFEGLNIALLCDLDSYKIYRFRGFSRMEEVEVESSDLSRRFEYNVAHSETTLLVDEDWALRLTSESQPFRSRHAPSTGTLPLTNPDIQTLALHRYESFEDIPRLAPDECYVPTVPNPLFDGFFVLLARESVELWVMQATVSRAHTAVPGSFETVQEVVARANQSFGAVRLKYLLVAPCDQARPSVVFNVPRAWSAVRTRFQVYVQFVDVTPFWTVEDVVGPCCWSH